LLLSEQRSQEQIADARALAELVKDKYGAWPALQRLIKRIGDDVIDRWARDESLKKKYVAGQRDALAAVLQAIEQTAADAEQIAEEQKYEGQIVSPRAEDGMGFGDLAI
jgi:ABC-type transporter Mla subunit MlaD